MNYEEALLSKPLYRTRNALSLVNDQYVCLVFLVNRQYACLVSLVNRQYVCLLSLVNQQYITETY